ncbi:fasciclin domain-containing protein [Croceibacter atlanticus]|uniref:fasciclin domain-containing protein n=1 Tax=Croceibacter atlanticus TaxID=313588 RepID=UPI0024BA6761|nr:fasciclin domain-containing protein [Croceibacter atlanticus]|tara:strand:+ start:395 stop:976 length:582 start_codon:yes stop_codon:yes gene_type:complete
MKISNVLSVAVLMAAMFVGTTSFAQDKMMKEETKMVGGAAMYPSKNIVENAVNSKDHTTLVAAVKAAGLVETLASEGPFTVFAPVNAAFDKLPEGTVETLLMEENKAQLQGVLTYHVVAGKVNASDLVKMIKKDGGKHTMKTVQGGTLTAMLDGAQVKVMDASGNAATVIIADVNQSNGVIHVIDTVLLPSTK